VNKTKLPVLKHYLHVAGDSVFDVVINNLS
jgi:hypothetical protein